mmetsp:Transcript_5313/g.11529  ORF Transcript_5313/g.11529 Transcript_5313/m.11529 type:complete len:280 (-) Transcript_5313:313-1152(-)
MREGLGVGEYVGHGVGLSDGSFVVGGGVIMGDEVGGTVGRAVGCRVGSGVISSHVTLNLFQKQVPTASLHSCFVMSGFRQSTSWNFSNVTASNDGDGTSVEGRWVGESVGPNVGRTVGRSVGRSVGKSVGRSVGCSDGNFVGLSVGESVIGEGDGIPVVGSNVGGAVVGSCVGIGASSHSPLSQIQCTASIQSSFSISGSRQSTTLSIGMSVGGKVGGVVVGSGVVTPSSEGIVGSGFELFVSPSSVGCFSRHMVLPMASRTNSQFSALRHSPALRLRM